MLRQLFKLDSILSKTIWILIYGLLAYLIICSIVFFYSDRLIYRPPTPASYQDTPNIIKLKTPTGKILTVLYLNNSKATYTILFSHGNSSDLGMNKPFLYAVAQRGYSAIGYDYEGYGTSQGHPSEANTYLDAQTIYNYLVNVKKIDPSHIILLGHSLGTGVTVNLALHNPCAGVILESPFLTVYRVISGYPLVLFDKYDNLRKIKQIHRPLLIVHGTADSVVPFWQGKALFEAANQPKYFLSVAKAGHSNFIALDAKEYWNIFTHFINNLPHPLNKS